MFSQASRRGVLLLAKNNGSSVSRKVMAAVVAGQGAGCCRTKSTTATPPTTTTAKVQSKKKKRLTIDTMCQSIVNMQYAVRGQVVIEADRITDELREHGGKDAVTPYPFDHVVYTNIGNPHSVGQHPLTWPRQVLALVDLPPEHGVDHPDVARMFPADAVKRAREIKTALGGIGSTGAYSHSQGVRKFREDVAAFIEARDGGVPSNPDNIFLTNGASEAIGYMLKALVAGPQSGVMIPIPQYPIYSATIDVLKGNKVGYYLNEEKNWELNIDDLETTLQKATDSGIDVNSFVLINPGNPTGNVLQRRNLKQIVKFCSDHNLVLLADEVYQENVYGENSKFVSCKRAAYEMGLLDDDAIELVSFHSVSKGVFGECGRRGGYMELVGIDRNVKDQIYKLASANLCSTVTGQIMVSLMVRGPDVDDESFISHQAEKDEIFKSLQRRSKIVSDGLNNIPGFSCKPADGSMYCFPAVELPAGAIREAERVGVAPDTFYAVSLLQSTGICVVPASGFGQKQGRYGFRTTFLPPEDEMERAVELIRDHYASFCKKYA